MTLLSVNVQLYMKDTFGVQAVGTFQQWSLYYTVTKRNFSFYLYNFVSKELRNFVYYIDLSSWQMPNNVHVSNYANTNLIHVNYWIAIMYYFD
jgi:hypothetical protein